MKLYIDNREDDKILVDVIYLESWLGHDFFVHEHPQASDCLIVSEVSTGFRAFKANFSTSGPCAMDRFQKMLYSKYETEERIKSVVDKEISAALEKYGRAN